jgi:hypothetical protein
VIASLANEDVAVKVDVAYGARITSLLDQITGREWMLQGGHGPDVSDSAVYLGDDAIGWDECFPTVASWDASGTVWGSVLRDHGALWGRPADLVSVDDNVIVTRQTGPQFALERRLQIEGRTLRALYRLDNLTDVPLPYLWAAHGMLKVSPADRIVLPGVTEVTATHLARDGGSVRAGMLDWPGPNTQWSESFSNVEPASVHHAAKLYASDVPGGAAYVGNTDGWLRIGWSAEIDSLGIWLNYGGWPAPGHVHHIGLEPTNAPVDHLGAAIARGTPPLEPRGQHEWSVTYTLRAPAPIV